MLDEVNPQKLKTFKVPTEEHYVVLVSLLESLDRPSSNSFELLLGSQKLVFLLQGYSWRFILRSSLKVLVFSFKVLASSKESMSFFFSWEFSFSRASILDVRDATLASWVRHSEAIQRLSPNTWKENWSRQYNERKRKKLKDAQAFYLDELVDVLIRNRVEWHIGKKLQVLSSHDPVCPLHR